MAKFMVMPKLGLTMTEGTITDWLKKEGDTIDMGETILEIETDKITKEFESPVAGTLRKILVAEGTVDVLKPIAIVGTADEDISELLAQAQAGVNEEAPAQETVEEKVVSKAVERKPGERVKASARAKKIAKDLGLDISEIPGTGPGGAVTEKDIRNFADKAKAQKVSGTAAVVAEGLGVDTGKINKDSRIMKADVYKFKMSDDLFKFAQPQEYHKAMSGMRRVIAKRMSESQNLAATVNYNQRVDTTAMKKLREELKAVAKVSYTDILVKVLAKVLLEYPLLNSSLVDNEIVMRNYASIGVAVALDEGLIVPVVKYANVKGLLDISKEIKELATKARNNQIQADDIAGGTFTISNIGMFGMESFTPIINQPEVAILGINTIQDTVMVVDGEIVIKPMMNLSLTADHRVVDGSVAAAFMAKVKEYIENPGLLLL